MNGLTASFPAASPGTFLFVDQSLSSKEQSVYSPSQTSSQHVSFDARTLGVREAARQRWEELKPIIRLIYIEEDRPYPYLADLLRTQHGFETTYDCKSTASCLLSAVTNVCTRKRQFSRKIIEWGFRKNVSSSERRNILQSLPEHTAPFPLYPEDPRLKPEKLRSWRKRYRDDVDEQPCHSVPKQSSSLLGKSILTYVLRALVTEIYKASTDMPSTSPDDQTHQEELDNASSPGTLQGSPSDHSPANSVSGTETPMEGSWLFNWSTVEVPRSPNLSRLFEALAIECSNPVPALSLEPAYLPDGPTCISESEMRYLFNQDNKLMNSQGDQLLSSGKCKTSLSQPMRPTNLNQQMAHPLLGDFASAVFFGYPASPLNELYVFSGASSTDLVEISRPNMTVWGSLASQEIDFESKLTKLKPHFGIDNPSIIATMETLAQIYYDRRKYAEAELLDRRLLKQHSKELGGEHLRTLDAQQRLVEALIAQGKYYEARARNRSLFSSLIMIGHRGTPRIAHMLSNDALIAEELGNTDEAEGLLRQVLQLWLTYCGPRDKRTLYAMTQLGYLLVLTRGPGGDKLLRTAVQLHLEVSNAADEDTCRAMTYLSAAFWAQDAHKEGCELAQNALEKFQPAFGHGHPDILAINVALARNMAKGGNLSGSEKIFREVVATESDSSNINPRSLSNSRYGLAKVLMLKGCFDESIKWYLEVLHARAGTFGWDNRYTLRVCYDLGECYRECKRFDDAIDLYRDVVRRLWMTDRFGNSCHPDIEEMESCINILETSNLNSKDLPVNDYLKIGDETKGNFVGI